MPGKTGMLYAFTESCYINKIVLFNFTSSFFFKFLFSLSLSILKVSVYMSITLQILHTYYPGDDANYYLDVYNAYFDVLVIYENFI